MLIHKALPEVDYDKIRLDVEFLGNKLSAPFLIASMTGGHPETYEINKNLAIAVENLNLGMGVGSQRAGIERKEVEKTFSVVREYAPNAFIYANIGIAQIIEHGIEYAEKAIEMVEADAIAIHLNFLQEVIQPEGDLKAKGAKEAISELVELKVPIIIKETGAGIAREVVFELRESGVRAIDVGGKGGTSWSGVEVYRARDELTREVGMNFWDWGLPTAFSIIDVFDILPTIATGGIRSGIDIAKAIAIGADMASSALPFLKPATKGYEEVEKKLKYFLRGLKTAMFLTGCEKIEDLWRIHIFISGKLKEWLEFREINIHEFLRRREK